ncbi:hypothetical protein WT72_11730 [Burkholderia pseudomultivorans]|uniref:hypothetical protein n=1 Tax=Burkholderia pseudomultivorans TaxID=1207504 RepID=UPI0007585213|nr:hypothetical protein [Burkholderia pseudomultivorans]KWI59127.1 hypothetical protein WT72_11730 [Burkholderia pseudomultivorans]
MKHGNGIRFATTGPAWRQAGRMRVHRPTACGAAVATLPAVVVRARAPLRTAAAASAAIAPRSRAIHRPARARGARAMPSPARRRLSSSVRLTLMQDHSS